MYQSTTVDSYHIRSLLESTKSSESATVVVAMMALTSVALAASMIVEAYTRMRQLTTTKMELNPGVDTGGVSLTRNMTW